MSDSSATLRDPVLEASTLHIDEQAMDWLIELKTTELSYERWEALETWLAADPLHMKTYDEFERHWRRLESASPDLTSVAGSDDSERTRFLHLFKSLLRDQEASPCEERAAPAAPSVVASQREDAPVVFVSYSARSDIPMVRAIADRLRSATFDPWIDIEDIAAGKGWKAVIENVLALSTFVLIVLSSRGLRYRGLPSKRTQELLDVCRSRMRDRSRLITVRLDACPLHRSLEPFVHVDLFQESGWQRLMTRLRGDTVRWIADRESDDYSARTSQSMLQPLDSSVHRPSLHRKVQNFPARIAEFLADVGHESAHTDTDLRRFMELTSCRLKPIVQVRPRTFVRTLLGFQCLALGPNGENFSAIVSRCGGMDPGVLRISVAIAALETIATLRADTSFQLQGSARLKFLMHLDSDMLDSAFLMPLLVRYWDELGSNLLFEINEETANHHYVLLRRLNAELNIRYAARNLQRWNDDARHSLSHGIAQTKMCYGEFRSLADRRKYDALEALRNLRAGLIRGAPLIVSALDQRRDLKRLEDSCVELGLGDIYGQGDALDAGQHWNAKTPPLTMFGVPTRGRALMRSG